MRLPVTPALSACLALVSVAAAQEPADTAAADTSALRVYLDCPNWFCDRDYFRTEIAFVNWVREPQVSQVHVLLTTQRTGAGGREFTLAFIGRERFGGTADTLRFASLPTATDDEIRRDIAKTLRLGLVRFAAHTPAGRRLEIAFRAPPRAAAQVRDPWDYWVFRVNVSTNFNGEESYKFRNMNGGFEASRVTEAWKIELEADGGYSESRYTIPIDSVTTETYTNIRRNYALEGLFARSLGAHWSLGVTAFAGASTFFNQDLRLHAAPAFEYAVWPYAESTRRLLTARYGIGPVYFNYADSTIFDQVDELLVQQRLSLSLDLRQPWGSTEFEIEGSSFLHDLGKLRLELFGEAEFRVFKGLSVGFFGSVALLRDQLYISKEGSTPEDVIAQRRQLETAYQYWGYVQLSYTFGSIYSNIVNPRFN